MNLFSFAIYGGDIKIRKKKKLNPKKDKERISSIFEGYLFFLFIHNIIAYQQQFTNFYSPVIFMKYCVICVSWEQYHTHKNPDDFNSYTYCPCIPFKKKGTVLLFIDIIKFREYFNLFVFDQENQESL